MMSYIAINCMYIVNCTATEGKALWSKDGQRRVCDSLLQGHQPPDHLIITIVIIFLQCTAVEKRSVWLCSMQCILLSRAIWLGQNNKSSFGISSAHPPPLDHHHHHHHDQKTPLDGDCPKNRSACVIKPRHARIPKPGDSHQHIGVFYICRPVFAIFVYFTWIVFMGPHFHYLQGLGFI